jgi:hypothetical protein
MSKEIEIKPYIVPHDIATIIGKIKPKNIYRLNSLKEIFMGKKSIIKEDKPNNIEMPVLYMRSSTL